MTDTTPVLVRDAGPSDRDAIRGVTLEAYAEYARLMEPSAWAGLERAVRTALAADAPDVHRIVAEHAGAVVGSVMLYPPATDAYHGEAGEGAEAAWPELRLLAVSRAARGLGVGRLLVDECARRARAMGSTDLGLHTSESMRAARRLYESMGFVRAPEHDFRPEGAELVEGYRLRLG